MKFITWKNSNNRDYVEEFFDDQDPVVAEKILTKLEHFQKLSFFDLIKAEHIKHISGKLYETRTKIKKDCYRFLGIMNGDIFWFLHAIKKKQNKIPKKEIKIAKKRLKEFLEK